MTERAQRYAIVNGDDFGASHGVSLGIVEAHERGVLTSASLMVDGAAARAAVTLSRAHPRLSIGLHLYFGQWEFVAGTWVCTDQVVPLDDRAALAAETDRQLAVFEAIVGRRPTHLDSHQHLHCAGPAAEVVGERAQRLGVPLRRVCGAVAYRGEFYGQSGRGERYPAGIEPHALIRLLRDLAPGWSEIACHPGHAHDLRSTYRWERERELRALCDPQVRATIASERIELRSFGDLARAGAPTLPDVRGAAPARD